jgi:hypothetical protein
MPFLHGIRDTVVRDKARTRLCQEARKDRCSGRDSGKTRRHEWNKEPRLKGAIVSKEREDIWHNLWENHRSGDCEANSWVFCQDRKNKCQNIVEEPATSKHKKKTAHGVRAMVVGTWTILITFPCTDRRKMMVINLDRLAP